MCPSHLLHHWRRYSRPCKSRAPESRLVTRTADPLMGHCLFKGTKKDNWVVHRGNDKRLPGKDQRFVLFRKCSEFSLGKRTEHEGTDSDADKFQHIERGPFSE